MSCLPLKTNHCKNVLSSRADTSTECVKMGVNKNSLTSSGVAPHVESKVTTVVSPALTGSDRNNSQPSLLHCFLERTFYECSSMNISNSDSPVPPGCINELFLKAYGASLVHSDGGIRQSQWCGRWYVIVHHRGLPGHVNQLSGELTYLCNGTYPAERILVISSVLLQSDQSVYKSCDIC